MSRKIKQPRKLHQLGSQLSDNESLHKYEPSFRRWLARELTEGRLANNEAARKFSIPTAIVSLIKKQYAPQIVTLGDMTESEKQQLEELQKRLKLLEKQLEDARIKNIALETLVDVAEKELKIPIRKKPGAKQ
jgi:hypothetical protein